MNHAVIMAGGTGKRLWPLSRQNRPKQVLRLFHGKTLLRCCFERLGGVFEPDRVWVMTNAAYVDVVRADLPDLRPDHVIAEPAVRDTVGAIGLASTILDKVDSDATLAVVTADHMIEPVHTFAQVLRDGLKFVNDCPGAIVTFGVAPTFASTQLGYIKLGPARSHSGCSGDIHPVEAFREKPDAATAEQYVRSGSYCWNSGMFLFKAATMLGHLAAFLPDSVEPFSRIRDAWGTPRQETALKEWFVRVPKTSIDYAVMEKASDIYAIRLNCRWLDLGSFTALAEMLGPDADGNVLAANLAAMLDSRDNIVVTEDSGHLVALLGVKDLVVAHSPDATLVCHASQAHRLKELLDEVARRHGDRFL